MCKEQGMNSEEIIETVGRPPVWKGMGFFRASEANDYKDKQYHPEMKAKKRALAEAIKRWKGWGYDAILDHPQMVTDDDLGEINGEGIADDDEVAGEWLPEEPEQVAERMEINEAIDQIFPPDPNKPKQENKALSQGQKGILIGVTNSLLAPGDTDTKRHEILKALFGKTSSKDLTPEEWNKLWDLVQPQKDSGGAYLGSAKAQQTFDKILSAQRDGQDALL